MEEIWKDLVGYEGLYEVSNLGRVRAVTIDGKKHDHSQIMRTHFRDGYVILGLTKNKKQRTASVHKIVAQQFVPNPHNYKIVYHKDGNKLNNKADNLIWSARKKLVLGIGINDIDGVFSKCNKERTSYKMWEGMIARCYNERIRHKHPTYWNCDVCRDWIVYSNFKAWFDDPNNGYKKGYELDKDILVKGNRIYSPSTCCFVPQEINKLFTKNNKQRGDCPIGVGFENGKFRAKLQPNGKVISLGYYDTKEEAFNAYKKAKEERIKNIAESYYTEGKITKRVYNAIMKYEVEITD